MSQPLPDNGSSLADVAFAKLRELKRDFKTAVHIAEQHQGDWFGCPAVASVCFEAAVNA